MKKHGQILVELLIALAIATILIGAATSTFINVGYSDLANQQYLQAELLADEAENILRAIAARSFSALPAAFYHQPVHPELQDHEWQLVSDPETIDIFSRQIVMEPVTRDPVTGQIAETGVLDPASYQFRILISWSTPISRQYERTFILFPAGGETRFFDTGVADFSAGLPIDTLVTDTAGGEVTLNYGGTGGGHVGPAFSVVGSGGLGHLDAEDKKAAYRFTSRQTKPVGSIYLYLESHNFPPNYRIGIQDGDLSGPSGNWLGATNQSFVEFGPHWWDGWFEVELQEPAPLVLDGIYYVVIEYASGVINSAKYLDLRVLTPVNQVWPYDNAEAPALNSLFYTDAAGWAEQNKNPVMVLGYADSTFEGFPYDYIWEAYVNQNDQVAEHYTQTEEDTEVEQISLWIRRSSSQPQGNLFVVLDDLTTDETLIDQVLATKETSRTYQYVTVNLSAPVTLYQGHEYRLWLRSPDTSWNRSYRVAVASNWPDEMLNSLNYQGTNAYREYRLFDSSWQPFYFQDLLFQFRALAETGYIEEGTFEARTFDAGAEVLFNRISWQADIPTGTNLQFQVAISSDPDSFNFIGPDGTPDTYFLGAEGQGSIPFAISAGRYFRYRGYFSTTDSSVTPTLYDFSVFYNN